MTTTARTLTDTFLCTTCGPVAVSLQVPDATPLIAVARDLAAITFESRVTHDIQAHLEGLVGK